MQKISQCNADNHGKGPAFLGSAGPLALPHPGAAVKGKAAERKRRCIAATPLSRKRGTPNHQPSKEVSGGSRSGGGFPGVCPPGTGVIWSYTKAVPNAKNGCKRPGRPPGRKRPAAKMPTRPTIV
ncbi:hypothetical protein DVDV_4172 [Desulfovibrio sp. DV]|nr:hypothetical protein DVDV_4172 [Desulfovibrio sp. DV]